MSFSTYVNRIKAELAKRLNRPRKRRRKPSIPLVIEYHEHWLLPPLAFFIGTLMVTYGHHIPFGQFVQRLDFYKAAVPSIVAAWAVMLLIVRNTRLLDANHPWSPVWWPAPLKRVLLQGYHGLAKPAFLILGIFSLYFFVRQRPELIPYYLSEDFPLVLVLLTGFNVLCWTYHQLRMDELLRQWSAWRYRLQKAPALEDDTEMLATVEIIPYAERVKDSVACYEPAKQGNVSLAMGFDGGKELDMRPLKDIGEAVKGKYFFMLRREVIIGRRAIREVREIEDGVEVILGNPRPGTVIAVSRRRRKDFMKWWQEGLPESGETHASQAK